MADKPDIQEILAKVDKLPSVNRVTTRIIKMLDDDNVKVNDLADAISLDQSLTTQLLKLCNSAHFGFSKKITSINDAVIKLGFKTIKNLTFMTISHNALNGELGGYSLEKGALWDNSITCAVYADYLAKTSGYHDPETAFTAGLLRDIGKLVIHEYVGTGYNSIIQKVNSGRVSFSGAEEIILGFDHSCLGAKLANEWNLPSILVDAIQYHHNFNKALETNCEDLKLIAIIHVADALTMMSGTGVGNDGLMYSINMKALEQLDIPQSPEGIEILFSNIVELRPEVEKMTGMINE